MTRPGELAESRMNDTGSSFPVSPESLPDTVIDAGRYQLFFARTEDDLDAILKLRFRVFNLELGEGLDESFVTQRDEDELDRWFHHLAIRLRSTGEIVGTYRMQTRAMAQANRGWYSAGEFVLDGFGDDVLDSAVEVGRACVAREHRNGRVLQLLWRGLASYLSWNDKHLLFGCCSLTSQDEALGERVYRFLERTGHLIEGEAIVPQPGLECLGPGGQEPTIEKIPALFQSYLNLGARICGPPAIDRLFKTIDFLVLLDVRRLDRRVHRTFFG